MNTKIILKILSARNNFRANDFIPVYANSKQIGFVHRVYKEKLVNISPFLSFRDENFFITTDSNDYSELTKIFQNVNDELLQRGLITLSHKGEMYRVAVDNFSEPLFEIARYSVPFWGVRVFGVHMNGLVRKQDCQMDMWYAQRSQNRSASGMLDHIVCGGQPASMTLSENLCKEAYEEAKMSYDITKQAIPVGTVSCWEQKEYFLHRFTPFMFDLLLPSTFKPISHDGSSSSFSTISIKELVKNVEIILDFKSSCQPVIISLLIRHGYITPDDENYIEICTMLLKGFFPYTTVTY